MKCPYHDHDCLLASAGGKAKVRKGFAITPMTEEARKKAWKTRKTQTAFQESDHTTRTTTEAHKRGK